MVIVGRRHLWNTFRHKTKVARLNLVLKVVVIAIFVLVLTMQMKLLFVKNSQLDTSHSTQQISKDGKQMDFVESHINMEVWHGLCLLNFNSLRQYPLFPWQPNEKSYLVVRDTLTINKWGPLVAVRTMGYFHPPRTGFYLFHLVSHVMSQLWISSGGPSTAIRVAYTTYNTVDNHGYFAGNPNPVSEGIHLDVGRKYYFELWMAANDALGKELVPTTLYWLIPNDVQFVKITGQNVSPYYRLSSHNHTTHRLTNDTVTDSSSLRFSDEEDKLTGPYFPLNKTTTTDRRVKLDFNNVIKLLKLNANPLSQAEIYSKLPYLEEPIISSAFSKCYYEPSYMKKTSYKRYEAVWYIHYPLLYPYDGSWNIRWGAPYKNQFRGDDRFDGAVYFQDKEAISVLQRFMDTVHRKYPEKYELSNVMNIEKVNDRQKGDRFLLELALRSRHDNQLHQVSGFFYRNSSHSGLCVLDNLRWEPEVWINVILNVKNQGAWMIYFIKEMARVLRETRDHHVYFIIVDYGNDGIDIDQEMERHGMRDRLVIKKSGQFHKTSSINMAVSHINDPNGIVLLMDLHLKYPNNFFHKIRKHTIQGKLAFAPIVFRLDRCGRPETKHIYSSGFWESLGFGIFSIYKSDWDNFGGMNEKEFKNKWGGEDWEMVDRVLAKGIEVDKLRVLGFYHFYHDKKGMWNN